MTVPNGERLEHKGDGAQHDSADGSVCGPESAPLRDLEKAVCSSYPGHDSILTTTTSLIWARDSRRVRHRIPRKWRTMLETSVSLSGRATRFLLLVKVRTRHT